MINKMKELADKYGVKPTKNAPRIAKAIIMMDCIGKCPCDVSDEKRGCISDKCLDEIKNQGICHCKSFERLD